MSTVHPIHSQVNPPEMSDHPIVVRITDGPLGLADAWTVAGVGALIVFEGIVRPLEDQRPLDALDYEAYLPMACDELRKLAQRIAAQHGLLGVVVEHSRGRVAVGACSFRLRIAARHRKEGLAAMDTFIDQMKRDIPIWKSPVFSGRVSG